MTICSSIPADSTPNHGETITIIVMFNDVGIMEMFMLSSPHQVPLVCKVQTIPGVIDEQNWNPIFFVPK
jgi:hypothetical protein